MTTQGWRSLLAAAVLAVGCSDPPERVPLPSREALVSPLEAGHARVAVGPEIPLETCPSAARVIMRPDVVHVDGTEIGAPRPWAARAKALPTALRDDWPIVPKDVLRLDAHGMLRRDELDGDGSSRALRSILDATIEQRSAFASPVSVHLDELERGFSGVLLDVAPGVPMRTVAHLVTTSSTRRQRPWVRFDGGCARPFAWDAKGYPLVGYGIVDGTGRVRRTRHVLRRMLEGPPPTCEVASDEDFAIDAAPVTPEQLAADARHATGSEKAQVVLCARPDTSFELAVRTLSRARRAAASSGLQAVELAVASTELTPPLEVPPMPEPILPGGGHLPKAHPTGAPAPLQPAIPAWARPAWL